MVLGLVGLVSSTGPENMVGTPDDTAGGFHPRLGESDRLCCWTFFWGEDFGGDEEKKSVKFFLGSSLTEF